MMDSFRQQKFLVIRMKYIVCVCVSIKVTKYHPKASELDFTESYLQYIIHIVELGFS